MASISINSHEFWPFADRHDGSCWPIARPCQSVPLTNSGVTNPFLANVP
jgi:hypothetical protein